MILFLSKRKKYTHRAEERQWEEMYPRGALWVTVECSASLVRPAFACVYFSSSSTINIAFLNNQPFLKKKIQSCQGFV